MEYIDAMAIAYFVLQSLVVIWCVALRMWFVAFFAMVAFVAVVLLYVLAPISI